MNQEMIDEMRTRVATDIQGLFGMVDDNGVLGAMSHLEKKHTETERLESAVSKMWIVTYINTAIILLLVGTKYDKLFSTTDEQGEKLGWMPILSGTHRDANSLWYETIGSGIIIPCFIMALTPCGNLIFLGVG